MINEVVTPKDVPYFINVSFQTPQKEPDPASKGSTFETFPLLEK